MDREFKKEAMFNVVRPIVSRSLCGQWRPFFVYDCAYVNTTVPICYHERESSTLTLGG